MDFFGFDWKMSNNAKLHYVFSCDLDVPVQIKIGTLEGKFEKPSYEAVTNDPSLQHCVALQDGICDDLFVSLQIFCDQKTVGHSIQTSHKTFTTRWNWNEWLTLPIRYSELSKNSLIAVTIWDFHDSTKPHAVGGTTLPLFSKRGIFRQGIYCKNSKISTGAQIFSLISFLNVL